jgi:hypothetical protein
VSQNSKCDNQLRAIPSVILKTLFIACSFLASPVIAEPTQLKEYLRSMDRTEVAFSGRIRFDSSGGDFRFYDENRDSFGVTVDAGRDTRERIEKECDNPSLFTSYSDLCTISGSGTIEIRGARINISIEVVDQLSK